MKSLPFFLVSSITVLVCLEAAILFGPPDITLGGILGLGLVTLWRYAWLILNMVRSLWYRNHIFPKIRARADRLPLKQWRPKMLHIVLPTYKERPEVTNQVFQHICREINSVCCPTYIYVASGGDEENRVILEFFEGYPFPEQTKLAFLKQEGKRHGMAFALRAARRRDPFMKGLVILMDGDSLFGENLFAKTLPLFALYPKLGAVTTNNLAVAEGPRWYQAWYALRFALRHRYMSSHSVSGKVLTLTGRFSVFRASAALQEEFIERVESDFVFTHAEGVIPFKTGDDKSTWYQLLKQGWDMLYVPDAFIICMETAGLHPMRESRAKMYRWFGNMLRNNRRALELGPGRLGWFIWLAILDQRISPWTSLMLPTAILLNVVVKNPMGIFFFLAWVACTRFLYLSSLLLEGHRLRPWDFFLILYQQWGGSFIKISVLSNLKQQAWSVSRGDGFRDGPPLWSRVRHYSWLILWILVIAFFVL